jgi:hypothetical protein
MTTRLARLLISTLTTLLLIAAAGKGVGPMQSTWAAPSFLNEEPPQQVLAPAWYWESWQKGAQAGASAAGAGDVNGDGFADLIVGAPKYEADIYRGGAAFVFYGKSGGLETEPRWIAGGEAQGNAFGSAVASAGDVNCDGYADVVVGAPNYGNNHGKVYLYYGSPTGLNSTPDWSYTSGARDAYLGWSVASAGDVNGDDCHDLLVGVRYFSDGQDKEGGAFLFYGSASGLSSEPDWIGQVNQAGAQFGYALSGASDLNQDGYDDVLVGAPYYEATLEDLNEGAIFLYYGSETGLSVEPDWSATGGAYDARLGFSISGGFDLNGDGYPDLAAGAPGWEGWRGAVFAYLGASTGPGDAPDWSRTGDLAYTGYGEAVALAGDLNGDEYGELLVGAWRYSNDQSKEGVLYVHHGGPGGPAHYPGWRAEGNKAETGFGYWVAAAGDVNKDGYGDIVVGAPYYRLNRDIMGRAFVYHGFYQEVVDGAIVPIDPPDDLPVDPVVPVDPGDSYFYCFLPVSTR